MEMVLQKSIYESYYVNDNFLCLQLSVEMALSYCSWTWLSRLLWSSRKAYIQKFKTENRNKTGNQENMHLCKTIEL